MAKTSESPIVHMIRRLTEDHCVKSLPDQELLRRFTSAQDDAAFAALVRRHGPMVLDVCRNGAGNEADAEDAFQATFLVLARKAKSIRNTASVGSWLHGVAYRTALHGRKEFARRRKHESHAPHSTGQESAGDPTWSEVQQLMHAELTAVSDPYRAPLVLCFLEGRTQDEAAKQLQISKTTLRTRLERGRALLRMRLLRRGLGPAALLAACSWPAATVSACLPRALLSATVKAATAFASGQATAGLVSGQVAILVASALKATLATKLKIATTVLLALALVPTLGGWGFHPETANEVAGKGVVSQPTPGAATPKAATRASKKAAAKTRIVSGRVLDVAGKPAAGAKLFLFAANDAPALLGKSAADGSFKLAVVLPRRVQQQYLVARSDGAGVDFVRIPEKLPTAPIELRVVHDLAIRGRVITTEGKPVAGVKVSVTHINAYADNSLDSFLTEWKKRLPTAQVPYGLKGIDDDTESFLNATTDADGRFTLAGAGAERFVQLRIRGDGIAESEALVVNRQGFDPKPYNQATADNIAAMNSFGYKWHLDGPELKVVAERERRIRGVVKDIDSGKPRAGVQVWLSRADDELVPVWLRTKTDAEGKYEIRGARKTQSYVLDVGSDRDTGFMGRQVSVKDTPGYEPIVADILVKKGVRITGRVIDAATKKPMPGWATVQELSANPFIKDYPDLALFMVTYYTSEDGTFLMVTIPGPVVLMGGPDYYGKTESFKYKPPVQDPKYPQYFHQQQGQSVFYGLNESLMTLQGNFCKVLDIKPGTDIVTQDIVVEQATALPVKIQDSQGRPLSGTLVTGISWAGWMHPLRIEKDTCAVYHLEPGKPRLMVFYEPTKKLFGSLVLKGDEKEPAVVKLGPPGAVKGRLVGEDGKPVVGVGVNLNFAKGTAVDIHNHIHHANLIETAADGKFQIGDVIPGANFSIAFRRGRQSFEPLVKMDHRSVRSGQTLNLGDVQVKRKSPTE